MKLTAKILSKLADNVSTDDMSSAKYVISTAPEELAKICMRDLDPTFPDKMAQGGFLVAGKNFGCGSAREQAVQSVKQKGIGAIVAKSVARIYYRNCINEGLMPIVCPEAVDAINDGDQVSIDVEEGTITICGKSYSFAKFPPFVMDILSCGGLIASVRREVSHK